MPKFTVEESAVREEFIRQYFKKHPKTSGPKMTTVLKKHDGSGMRPTRIYELRDEVLETLGWNKDEHGNPTPHSDFEAQAFRKEGAPLALIDPLADRCVIPIEGTGDAVSFQQKLQFMNDKGFLDPKLTVEAATDLYLIVARIKP